MNKGELIEAVAATSDLSRADATKAVDAVLSSVTSTLAGGGSVALVGFGTFTVKARAARMGRNPRTGEPIQIKASNVPGFKAGKALKEAVNVPKPTNATAPPPANVEVTLERTASTALVASALDRSEAAATASISSPLFMHSPLPIDVE